MYSNISNSGMHRNTLITTFVATLLIPKLGLNVSQSGMLMMVLQQVMLSFDEIKNIFLNINIYHFLLSGLCILGYHFKNNINGIFRYKKKDYIQLNIYDVYKIKIIKKYMEHNPQFFNKKCNTNFGDPKMLAKKVYDSDFIASSRFDEMLDNVTTDPYSKIKINDHFLGLTGYMYWKIFEYEIKKKKIQIRRLVKKFLCLT